MDTATLLIFLAYLTPDFISVKIYKAGCDGVEDDNLKNVINDEASSIKRYVFKGNLNDRIRNVEIS